MAEEEETQEEESGSDGLRAVLIPAITAAITAVLVGAGLYFFVMPKQQAAPAETKEDPAVAAGLADPANVVPGDAAGAVPEADGKHTGIFHNYDSFVVSIFDREKVHYLRIKIALEMANPAVADEIVAKDPQIKDSMIFVLGDFTVRELLDNQAKLLVKEVLLKTLNKILGKGKILDVYFTEFVVQ